MLPEVTPREEEASSVEYPTIEPVALQANYYITVLRNESCKDRRKRIEAVAAKVCCAGEFESDFRP